MKGHDPLKIALVTHNVVRGDGQGRVNYELVRHCRSVGIGVNIISEKLAPEILDTGAVWHRLGLWISKPDLLHCMHFTPRANSLVRQLRDKVDLVVANGAVLREPHAVNICHFVHGALEPLEHARFQDEARPRRLVSLGFTPNAICAGSGRRLMPQTLSSASRRKFAKN